ncbi:MAG: zinc-ribbon domain-containing protein [Firmicutes bacterium]|nr:zinc-ribbon domain-containing protein [Bacillota bacterium]
MIQTILLVLTVIGLWRVFEAVDIPGWWALVPFASTYKLISKFWSRTAAVIAVILAAIGAAIVLIGLVLFAGAVSDSNGVAGVLSFLLILSSLFMFIPCAILSCIALYKVGGWFGRGTGFSLGLAFLPPVFLMILGFGGYLNPAAPEEPGNGGAEEPQNTARPEMASVDREPSADAAPAGSDPSVSFDTESSEVSEPAEEFTAEAVSGECPSAEEPAAGVWPEENNAAEEYPAEDGNTQKIRPRCPSCGAPLLDDAAFCTVCGQKL